jgi:tetratricopeptide (TPR) repeat protein
MTREAMAIPITSGRHVMSAWVRSMGAWVLWHTGFKQEARDAIIEAHKLSVEYDDHLIRSSTLDGLTLMAPDYMTDDQAVAERLAERDWLYQAGVIEDSAADTSDRWYFLRELQWNEALEYVEHLLALPQRNWRLGFYRQLKKSALLQLLDRPEEAAILCEQLVAKARNAIDRHHALCHLAIARRDVGDIVGSEAARAEAMQYLLDGHNPDGGWQVDPTNCIGGWMLLLRATLLIETLEDTTTIERVVGVGYGLLDQEDVDFGFELACVRHGYEDALPEPDVAARAFAATASLSDVLAFIDS